MSPRQRRRMAGAAVAASGMTLGFVNPARAQVQVKVRQDGSAAPAFPQHLSDLLEKVAWNPQTTGALLVIGAEKTLPAAQTRRETSTDVVRPQAPPALPAPRNDGLYRLNDWNDYFARRVVGVGTVSVFAPSEMTVFADRLPAPNGFTFLGGQDRLRFLEASLTPVQWRALGSAEGLGISDLSGRQRDLFLSVLPDPLVVGGAQLVFTEQGLEENARLTGKQREQVRLSLRRGLDWFLVNTKGGSSSVGADGFPSPMSPYRVRTLAGDENRNPFGGAVLGGVLLRQTVPAKLKPGHLPFDWNALDAPLRLDAKTVGELVEAARKATGAELYCDSRYRRLSVYVKGETARTGDVLKALCWAVTGTWRKVGERAFVLTDDVEGLGTRQARIGTWAMENAAQALQIRHDARAKLAASSFADFIPWTDNDPLKPSEALAGRIEAFRREQTTEQKEKQTAQNPSASELLVPVADLPAAGQEYVKRQIESWKQTFAQPPPGFPERSPLRTDVVRLNTQIRLSLVIPGLGTVPFESSLSSTNRENSLVSSLDVERRYKSAADSKPSEPVSLPPLPTRALLVAVKSANDIKPVAAKAKQTGFTELWVEVEGDENGAALTRTAVEEARFFGLSVRAAVRTLRADNATQGVRDRNILGETFAEFAMRMEKETPLPENDSSALVRSMKRDNHGDWLAPSDSSTEKIAQERLALFAKLPGLAGLVARDMVPPGYGEAGYRGPFDTGENELGYTEAQRLAFLQEFGSDPVDLGVLQFGDLRLPWSFDPFSHIKLSLPFFPDYGNFGEGGNATVNGSKVEEVGAGKLPQQWNVFRRARANAFYKNVATNFKRDYPNVPLLVQWGQENISGFVPAAQGTQEEAVKNITAPVPPKHSDLYSVSLQNRLLPGGNGPRLGILAKSLLQRKDATDWTGFVVDLSSVSVNDALPMLDDLAAPSVSAAGR